MKTLTKTTIAAAIALMMTITNGCKKEDMNNVAGTGDMPAAKEAVTPHAGTPLPPIQGSSAIELKLISTPINGVGAVDVEIRKVLIHYADMPALRSWVTLSAKDDIYDLEQYHDGKSVALGFSTKMPMGKIDAIQLLIGKKNSIVKADADGLRHVYPLIVSGASQNAELMADIAMRKGTTLIITIDFNAQKSVNYEGGMYLLTPALALKDVEYIPQMIDNQ